MLFSTDEEIFISGCQWGENVTCSWIVGRPLEFYVAL
jgi:hypothetical protein